MFAPDAGLFETAKGHVGIDNLRLAERLDRQKLCVQGKSRDWAFRAKKERLAPCRPFLLRVVQAGSRSAPIQLCECVAKHICGTIHIFLAKNQRRRKDDLVADEAYQDAMVLTVLVN